MKLYISEGAIWLLTVFYLPLVAVMLWQVWRHLPKRMSIKIVGVVGAAFLAAVIPLGDVMLTSLQMARLCGDAGVVVQRTVTAEGFYSNIAGESQLERGFQYIEQQSGDRVKIFTKSNGQLQIEQIDAHITPYAPKSRYEFIYGYVTVLNPRIAQTRSVVRDRATGEELGVAIHFTAHPGWFDQNTIARFGRLLWMCPEEPAQASRLMREVIKPHIQR